MWISHYPILCWSHNTQCVFKHMVWLTHCLVWIFTTMTLYCAIAFWKDSWQLFVRVEAEAIFLLVLSHLAQRLLRRKLPERKLYVSGKFWAILKSHVLSLCIASYSTLAYDSFVIHSSCVRECSLTFMNWWVIFTLQNAASYLFTAFLELCERAKSKASAADSKKLWPCPRPSALSVCALPLCVQCSVGDGCISALC